MSELYLMRGTLGRFCFAPFAVEGMVHDEISAFAHPGRVFCRVADTEDLVCPQTSDEIGDVIEILLALCWSNKATTALDGIRWSSTLQTRDIEIRNSEDQILGSFQWAVDFGRYDILNRQRSLFSLMKGTNVIMRVDSAVVHRDKIPPADIWGSMYGPEFFVTAEVKRRITQAGCVGFSFRSVAVEP